MGEENQPIVRREFPWLLTAEFALAIVTFAWLAWMVDKDYDPVKNLPITMASVGGNEAACVEAHPIQAIMATAWQKATNWDLGLLGDQYFIMGPDGQVESVWTKNETLEHLETPDYQTGDSVCVVFSRREEVEINK